jgi:predicted Fe-Mo cluster-binding NifX family protein
MRVVLPIRDDRISPVLDEARRCVLVDLDAQPPVRRTIELVPAGPRARAADLAATGADLLICGVLSRQLELALRSTPMVVRPHVCGQIDEVLAALGADQLDLPAYAMPGCCGRRRRRSRRGGCSGRRRGGRRAQTTESDPNINHPRTDPGLEGD